MPATQLRTLLNTRIAHCSTRAPAAAVDELPPENQLVEFLEVSASPHLQLLKLIPMNHLTHAPGAAVVEPPTEYQLVEFLETSASPHLQFLKLNPMPLFHARTGLRQVNLADVH